MPPAAARPMLEDRDVKAPAPDVLATMLIATFLALAALHVYWAAGGRWGASAAVPSKDGRPLFRPSRMGTLGVALALIAASGVVLGARGWAGNPEVTFILRGLLLAIALMFFLRAIGNFRSVGFFKQPNDSAFASLDTLVYSPLCLAIALAALVVSWRR